MTDFTTLTLSDFYNMPIGEREDGSLTPVIDYVNDEPIGLAGFRGDKDLEDWEVAEEGFLHYKNIMEKLSSYPS